ncbi:MAG TPA: Gfo/Idh/MocA family oxidoreductase [Gemmatimonadales bacterium]|jgi:predicted dehydrogenase|nr:Gfo/Idh/MocA family oxidoreductase [Gemmatimonadales bacterium]
MKRREFVQTTAAASLSLLGWRRWHLPSDRVTVAVMGLNGRGSVLARTFARTPNVVVGYLCDVDSQVLAKAATSLAQVQTTAPKTIGDFRRALEDKNVDALVIAAPDHWHTPAAILAMRAGKHVYVEKPCGHNPHEGELIAQAQQKYGRVVQMGTQQRSEPSSIEVIQAIRDGAIGRPYQARAWYANTRGTIGRGKEAPVPANLDYELWQGPAPRTPYRDNVIHYNWHWFHRWGTGEICNNGTHEIDVSRWALGVNYPTRVASTGGRYQFNDDWEFPDTQEATFEFPGGETIIWQGQSCNGLQTFGRGRGTAILGTGGSVVLDRDGYIVYDLKNQVVKQVAARKPSDGLNVSADDTATGLHIANFVDGVRSGSSASLHQPIDSGAKSVLLCHLGNIAQQTGRGLRTDPTTGRIVDDADAMTHWQREYAPGWMPTV